MACFTSFVVKILSTLKNQLLVLFTGPVPGLFYMTVVQSKLSTSILCAQKMDDLFQTENSGEKLYDLASSLVLSQDYH